MKVPSLVLGLVLALPSVASAQTIERFKAPAVIPVPILQGAIVPTGTDTFYLSGQLAAPIDPKAPPSPALTLEQVGDTRTQTISVLGKIKSLLEAHGYKMSDVIKLTVFVVGDPRLGGKADLSGMNDGYKQFFGTSDNPNVVARSAVQVAGLATPAFLVEIEAIAAKPSH